MFLQHAPALPSVNNCMRAYTMPHSRVGPLYIGISQTVAYSYTACNTPHLSLLYPWIIRRLMRREGAQLCRANLLHVEASMLRTWPGFLHVISSCPTQVLHLACAFFLFFAKSGTGPASLFSCRNPTVSRPPHKRGARHLWLGTKGRASVNMSPKPLWTWDPVSPNKRQDLG